MAGHPDDLPDLFLDRSLGRHQVATILRAADLRVRTLAEVYGIPADESVTDVEWLSRVGNEGWVALMKDERIRYREVERDAILAHKVRAFCLVGGNLRAADMAERYLAALTQMNDVCRQPGPFLYAVSSAGLRRLALE
jgi:hypothetical protein